MTDNNELDQLLNGNLGEETNVVDDMPQSMAKKGSQKVPTGSRILLVISDILATAAFIIALYLVWQLWWTGVIAQQEQTKALETVQWDEPEDWTKAAVPLDGEPVCDAEPTQEKTMIGRSYIPRFGPSYTRNMVQGTNKIRVLDLMGYGHYEGTAMPGCIGNSSFAAHRNGYGEPLGPIETMQNGDAMIIRTAKYWYVYKMYDHEIVTPDNGQVISPVPNQPSATPIKRLLTYTTCHPKYTIDKRYIVHGELAYWATVKSGVPQELLEVGFKPPKKVD